MAEIDISKRKPRRTAGTPSYYYRNRFAGAIIVIGCTIFGILNSIPIIKEGNKKFFDFSTQTSIEFQERKALFNLVPQKKAADLLKYLNESEDIKKQK